MATLHQARKFLEFWARRATRDCSDNGISLHIAVIIVATVVLIMVCATFAFYCITSIGRCFGLYDCQDHGYCCYCFFQLR